jgi:predicted GIY-YIG superfamily endonuclease
MNETRLFEGAIKEASLREGWDDLVYDEAFEMKAKGLAKEEAEEALIKKYDRKNKSTEVEGRYDHDNYLTPDLILAAIDDVYDR